LSKTCPRTMHTDIENKQYLIRHLPDGRETQFQMNAETANWARDTYRMMEDFREDFLQQRIFDEDTLAFNPVTGTYFPRDYSKKVFFEVHEAALPDDIFAAPSASHITQSRQAKFGTPVGRTEAFKELYREPETQLSRIMSRYIRQGSSKASVHNLAEAMVQLYGMPKSRFMEAYKVGSNGRGVEAVIINPQIGSRIKFKRPKAGVKEGDIALRGDLGPQTDEVLFQIERRANEEWKKLA